MVLSENTQKISMFLTFDLEIWSEDELLEKHLTAEDYKNDYLEETLSPILDMLDKYKNKATFFVTKKVIEKNSDLIKKIHQNGHEIALHGPIHQRLDKFSISEFENEVRKSKELIKNIIGKTPKGFRAAYFSISNKTRWILPVLTKQGFVYDSSVFPAKGFYPGVPLLAPTDIYKISFDNIFSADKNSSIFEIPLTVCSFCKIKIPIAGGVYFRLIPFYFYVRLLKKEQKKRIPILYFHPHELYKKTPRLKQGPWLRRKIKYYGVNNSLNKFERLFHIFKFDSIENILKL